MTAPVNVKNLLGFCRQRTDTIAFTLCGDLLRHPDARSHREFPYVPERGFAGC
ncbi:MAG: hypothetical protein ACLR4Z_13745 [Butyricicoccaceae bacterium]